jgi:hypothetical protein
MSGARLALEIEADTPSPLGIAVNPYLQTRTPLIQAQ